MVHNVNESNSATRMPQANSMNQLCLSTHYTTWDILTCLSFLDWYFSFLRYYCYLKVSSLLIFLHCHWHFNFDIHLIPGCLARSLESCLCCRILIPACRCLMQHLSSATLVIITLPPVYWILLLSSTFQSDQVVEITKINRIGHQEVSFDIDKIYSSHSILLAYDLFVWINTLIILEFCPVCNSKILYLGLFQPTESHPLPFFPARNQAASTKSTKSKQLNSLSQLGAT